MKPTRVIAYVRVSSAEQAASGLGLAAQRRTIEAEVARRGWSLVETISDEGESGKSLDRPGLTRALQAIANGEADCLMAAKLDRLSRSVGDFAALLEWFTAAAATLVALDLAIDTSTPGGKMVANVFAAVAEWERDTIAARTRDGLASLRAKGKTIGRPAVVDRPQLAQRIRRMRARGMTLQAIADRLNRQAVPTARGASEWRPSSVQAATGYKRPRVRKAAPRLPAVPRRPTRRRRGPVGV